MLVDENGLGGNVAVQHPGARVQETQALRDLPNIRTQTEIKEHALLIMYTRKRQNTVVSKNYFFLSEELACLKVY